MPCLVIGKTFLKFSKALQILHWTKWFNIGVLCSVQFLFLSSYLGVLFFSNLLALKAINFRRGCFHTWPLASNKMRAVIISCTSDCSIEAEVSNCSSHNPLYQDNTNRQDIALGT